MEDTACSHATLTVRGRSRIRSVSPVISPCRASMTLKGRLAGGWSIPASEYYKTTVLLGSCRQSGSKMGRQRPCLPLSTGSLCFLTNRSTAYAITSVVRLLSAVVSVHFPSIFGLYHMKKFLHYEPGQSRRLKGCAPPHQPGVLVGNRAVCCP